MTTQEKAMLNYLKVLVTGQLLLESYDELKKSPIYKHSFKNHINKASKALEYTLNSDLDKMYQEDSEMASNILRSIEVLISKIGSYNIDELVLLNKAVDNFEENKDWIKYNMNVDFVKIDT